MTCKDFETSRLSLTGEFVKNQAMDSRREENNPWKRKGRIARVAFTDIVIAIFGIIYSTYRMFNFYWNIENEDGVTKSVKDVHFPFYIFIWVVVLILYTFQFGCSFVLYSAINQEAIESDPYISIQKCNCWCRCSRVLLGAVVVKLCLQPVIIYYYYYLSNVYSIVFGIVELMFRSAAIYSVNRFMHDLQQ